MNFDQYIHELMDIVGCDTKTRFLLNQRSRKVYTTYGSNTNRIQDCLNRRKHNDVDDDDRIVSLFEFIACLAIKINEEFFYYHKGKEKYSASWWFSFMATSELENEEIFPDITFYFNGEETPNANLWDKACYYANYYLGNDSMFLNLE